MSYENKYRDYWKLTRKSEFFKGGYGEKLTKQQKQKEKEIFHGRKRRKVL